MNKIIAIVGMSGSGKSVASTYLESMGYSSLFWRSNNEKTKRRGLRSNTRKRKNDA